MKNIKIGEKANEKLVHYTNLAGMSKRGFLDIVLIYITPYELKQIFGRVWEESAIDENVGQLIPDEDEEDLELEYDDDEDDPIIEFKE